VLALRFAQDASKGAEQCRGKRRFHEELII
jgi:hypothetical protein